MKGQLPRVYLRMDPDLDHHPDYAGMVLLMCAANRARPRGHLTSELVVRILGQKRAREFMTVRPGKQHPDLVALANGLIYLDGWDDWQEGDLSVGDRVKRLRERRNRPAQPLQRNALSSSIELKGVTQPLPPALPERYMPPIGVRRQALGVEASPPVPDGTVVEGNGAGDDGSNFVTAVLELYCRLPGTREKATASDRKIAAGLHRDGYSIDCVRAGLLMATARRELRNREQPLPPIGSLAYFIDAIKEARASPPDADYVDHLAEKIEGRLKGPPKPEEESDVET